MTGHLPRKLLLGFLVLLLVTLLVCVTLQIQGPWPRGFPLKPLRFYYTGRDFNTSVDYQQPLEDELDIDEEQKPNPTAWLFHNQSQLKADIGPAETNLSRPELRNPTKPSGAVKPTQPDFFGDHYAEDDIPSQTTCPSSIRKRVRQTQFAQMFLQKIPVLQWAKHFSAQEYQRLRRYGGAHGWGSVDAQVLKSALLIMNTSANRLMFDDWEERKNQSQCIRCAVVGNGGILRGSSKGKEIDQHHYVFRVNGAALKGFEADVGSRTSFYTFSTNTMRNSIRSYAGVGYRGPPLSEETRFIFLPDHDRDYILMRAAATHTAIDKGPERSKSPPTFFGNDATVEKFKIYHPDFIRYLRNRFLHSNLLKTSARTIYRPSTGAVMLLAALHTCDQVDAYGFMTPDYDRYSDHYYDKQRNPVRFYANHDMRMEMRLWQQLHQAGLMTLYMRHQ